MIESQKDAMNIHPLKSPESSLQRKFIESQKNAMNSHPQKSLCFNKTSSTIAKRKTDTEKREKKSPWMAFLFSSSIRGGFLKALLGFLSFTFVFSAQANVGGTDLQNFNPTINGLDFVTVHSTRTLKPYQMNFGAFLNYMTNSLPLDKTRSGFKDTQKLTDPNDLLLYSNLHFAVGVLSNWEMGFSIGSANSQAIKNNTKDHFLFSYDNTGLNDIRFHSKLRFIEQKEFSMAAVGSIDFERIKQNPFSGKEPDPSFQLEAVADMRIDSHFLWAVNFGYRVRQKGDPLWQDQEDPKKDKGKDALLSNQILYSSAISYATDDEGSAIIGEIYGGYFTEEQNNFPSDRQLSSLEALAGYRLSSIQNLDLHLGAGTKFYKGFGSPDLRIYIGFNWRADELSKAFGLKIDNTQTSPRSMKRRKKERTKQEPQRMDDYRQEPQRMDDYKQEPQRTDDYRQEPQGTDDYKQEPQETDDYKQEPQRMDYRMEKEGKGYNLEEQVEPFYEEENTTSNSNSFSEPGVDSSPLQKNSGDSDNDGVEDSLDRCLNTPSGTQVDIYGCGKQEFDQ